ncbi:MAG: amidohydrolase family protein [Gaiellales bacterium]
MTTLHAADWVLPGNGAPPIRDGAVEISDEGLILGVGPAAELRGEPEHHAGCVILPGLVNAHTHLEYAVYGGFGDGLAFTDWLRLHVDRKRRLSFGDMEAIARLGAAECLASGVTTVGDASFSGAGATAADTLGLRAIVHLEVFGDPGDLTARFEPNRERIAPALSDRVALGVSPHAPYTASAELYRACLALGLPVSTHLAESEAETAWLTDGSGPWSSLSEFLGPPAGTTGIRALAERGALGPSMSAAHCVTVDDEEISLLSRHDVAVVHCPRSNAYLGCGIAPVAKLRGAGLRVGLGTDSPASAGSFDMFEELRAAVTLSRAREADSSALTAGEALDLATVGSAAALGLDREIGSLEPGKRADLTIVDLSDSPLAPVEDPAVALVLAGTPTRVSRTIVGGATRYARGGSGWHELRLRAAAARARMLESSPPTR